MLHTVDALPTTTPATMTVDDASFVRLLRRHIRSLISTHYAEKSSSSRKNLLVKDVRLAASKGKTDDIRPGMMVSHDGKRWQVIRTAGHTANEPTKALLRRAGHDTDTPVDKMILMTDILQLGDPNPDTHIPRMCDTPATGDFVLIDEDALVLGGRVTEVVGDDMLMHLHYPSATLSH